MWKCLNCEELLEDTFDVCWNCGADPDGNINPEFPTDEPNKPAASSSQPQPIKGKTKELGIFAIGLGIICGALVLYMNHIFSAGESDNQLVVALAIPAAFIAAGILTLLVRIKPMVIFTTSLIVVGFAIDLLLEFNSIKLLMTSAVIFLVLKTSGQALKEIESGPEVEKP